MHTLAFLDPGHFHAALTLAEGNPLVRDEIFVYARPGSELDDFLALVEAFNRREKRPTAWRPVVRAGDGALDRLVAERPADVAILAGRNDTKAAAMRRLHDAGLHVLADKPWLAGAEGLDDVRHVLAGGPLAVEIMTGRHEITSKIISRLVADAALFGDLADEGPGAPAIEIASVHHLEKLVNGAPLRRPAWFFDVRVQGDGIADIPTHMVDQCQRLVAAASRSAGAPPAALELIAARRSATRVPRDLFARVTGCPDFPAEVGARAGGSELSYRGNAELSFGIGGVTAALATRWDLTIPPGGGDTHRTVIRGTRAHIRVEQGAATGFRRRLSVVPRASLATARLALDRAVARWHGDWPGLAVVQTDGALELEVPRHLDTGHESHFPLVLAEFLAQVDRGAALASVTADTLAKYALLARASTAAT